jgi:hypothetical protein
MERDYRDQQRKGYVQMRSVADFTMAALILIIGIIMVIGDKFGIKALTDILQSRDNLIRYLFGGLCLFYGGFRLYRAIKKDY